MIKSTTVPTNAQLMHGCRKGDDGAWQQLVHRYSRLIHSIPVRYGLTPAEVDDIGQDVFLALAKNVHQIQDPDRLPAWLVTTARRLSWRQLRRRQRETTGSDGDLSEQPWMDHSSALTGQPVPTMDQVLTMWDRQETIAQGMQRLREPCRVLLTLLFLDPDELSYAEISQRLQMAAGSIGPTRIRCLQQLREILLGLGYDEID